MTKKIIESEQHLAVKYVLKGASKDHDRPILYQTIDVQDGYFRSANGFVAHFAKGKLSDEDGCLDAGTYKIDKQLLAETVNGTYPDLCALLPTREPIFSVCVNPALLRDALPDVGRYTNRCILEFYGHTSPVLVRGALKDDTEVIALVMPMNIDSFDADFDPCGVIEKRKPGALTILRGSHPWVYERDPKVMKGATGEAWWKDDGAKCWFVYREAESEAWKGYYMNKMDGVKCLPHEGYSDFQNTSLEALIDAFIPFIDDHPGGLY